MDIERLNKAVGLRDAGRFQEALREFQDLREATPEPEEKAALLINESGILADLGRFEEAHNKVSEADNLCAEPELRPNILLARSDVLAASGQREAALDNLEQALKQFGESLRDGPHRFLYEEIQIRRGVILNRLGRVKEARGVLEECLTFDLRENRRPEVLFSLGCSYHDLGDTDRAKRTLAEFLLGAAEPEYVPQAHFRLGVICFRDGAFAKALLELEWCARHAQETGASASLFFEWLAATHRALGQKSEAERYEKLAKHKGGQTAGDAASR